ncbi:bifunctional heptose 7-phosphate kinase/heptose 1-phosphate adenyltransferase [Conexivisphaera calida]|uniref:ADP-heptose synthase n=1 Tax=Conexivisphaera calida TaxID=1874277 RepID=A0A4P2VHU7_9ARCH|nr:PfkB family carbohydrate kinase [Conexivisphaera calida]BBE42772.1 ADP-heptose synthase [Conexivisphaera calida]
MDPGPADVLGAVSNARIMVIGDSTIDRYSIGRVTRVSPEAPVPLVEVQRESYYLGGATNAALLLSDLGAKVDFVSVVGDDPEGEMVRWLLRERGVETGGVVASSEGGFATIVVHRVISRRYQLLMMDRAPSAKIGRRAKKRMLEHVRDTIDGVDAVLFSDHRTLLQEGVVVSMLELARGRRERGLRLIVNPKAENAWMYSGVDVIRINRDDASRATGITYVNETSVRNMGLNLASRTRCGSVLITWIEDGAHLIHSSGKHEDIAPTGLEPRNLAGVGDVMSAFLTAALVGGADVSTASRIAYYLGSVMASNGWERRHSAAELREMLSSEEFSKWFQRNT